MAGCTTGAMAVALAQPTDVVKVRFQAQISAGASKRYHGTMDAYRTIAKEEGFRGLWKGELGHMRIQTNTKYLYKELILIYIIIEI